MTLRLSAALFTATLALHGCATTRSTAPSGATPGAAPASQDRRSGWLELFARGYFPGRSGQVFYVPREGDFVTYADDPLYRFMHGSSWDYDSRIPLIFHGPAFIRQGTWNDPVAQQDVAPTLAALMGTTAPATATGRVLHDVLRPTTTRARLVAIVVLDGFRAEDFKAYADVLPTLTAMRDQGAWFPNARVNSMPTLTSVGHATIGTGTDPRIHGLVVNNLFNRVTGKPQESFDQLDPGELMALTLADVWNIATDGKAIIIGQGGAIRATAGLVGHGACVINGRKVMAASYSARDGGWETNPTCYTMPSALASLNAKPFWQKTGGTWRGHDIASPRTFRASAVFQQFEGEALAAVLEQEPIGQDEITDLVLVNVKSPDYVSHAYGPASEEMRDTLREMDRQLARAFDIIRRKAGVDGAVTVIASDHGMPGEPVPPRRRITMTEVVAALNERFSPTPPSIVQYFGDPANAQIHLDTARLTALGHTTRDVAAFLESRFFAAVFTEDEVRAARLR